MIQEKMRQDDSYKIVQVCVDYPGVEMSRDYYLEKIKQLMTDCKQPQSESVQIVIIIAIEYCISIVYIWYTGHGEMHIWYTGHGVWYTGHGVCIFYTSIYILQLPNTFQMAYA